MNLPLSENIVPCLGWTLLHFLWQGLLVAGGFAVCARVLRSAPANQRYLAGCVALSAMILAPLITLEHEARQFQPPPPVKFVAMTTPPPEIAAAPAIDFMPAPAQSGPPMVMSFKAAPTPIAKPAAVPPQFHLSDHIDDLLAWLVIAWAVGVCALSSRLAVSWLHVKRLQSRATTALTGEWPDRLAELMCRLEVSRPVRLFQSALVEVPTVIGWLRPVILLPASCLAGLSPAQLEAVLAHELAHIRRHDYLVNLLQSAVETLLFYHPAVWWISRRIREERELCCDDLAVRVCRDRVTYARALATLEELRLGTARVAVAAGGAPLLERIRRLAAPPQKEVARSGWVLTLVLALTAIAAVAVTLWSNGASAQGGPVGDDARSRGSIAGASVPVGDDVRSRPPLNAPTIKPVVTPPAPGSSSGPTSTWESATGEQYEVQVTTNLSLWTVLATVTATGPTTTFIDPTPLAIPSFRFYRILPMPHAATTSGRTNTSEVKPRSPTNEDLPQIKVSPSPAKAPGATSSPTMEPPKAMNQLKPRDSATNGASPQVRLQAKFVQMNHQENGAVDADNFLRSVNLSAITNGQAGANFSASTSTSSSNEPGDFPLPTKPVPKLDKQQLALVLQALEQRPGVEVLTAPEVTTLSGLQVQMQAEDVQTVVNGTPATNNPANPSLPIGPQLDLIPYVSDDEQEISLTVLFSETEFLGYDAPGEFVVQAQVGSGVPITSVLPQPHFRVRSTVTKVVVPDGQTVVLVIPNGITRTTKVQANVSPSANPAETMTKTPKDILIFITPTLINPDGTRYHSEDELPRTRTLPPPAITAVTTNASAVGPQNGSNVTAISNSLPPPFPPKTYADRFFPPRPPYNPDAWSNAVHSLTLTLDQRRPPGVLVTYGVGKPLMKAGQEDSATPRGDKLPVDRTSTIDGAAAIALLQVEQEYEVPLRGAQKQTPNNYIRTNVVSTSKGRLNIKAKLDRIIIDSVTFDGVPLADVIGRLSEKSLARDPDRVGINFMFDHTEPSGSPEIDPATGLPLANSPESPDIYTTTIRIKPELRNMTLAQVLDAVVASASTPIRYTIEDYAVMFALKPPEKDPLFTRGFHLNPAAFTQALANFGRTNTPKTAPLGGANSNTSPVPTNGQQVGGLSVFSIAESREQAEIIAFLQAAGVNLSPTNSPRRIFWNDRKGVLLVTARAVELEIVAKVLEGMLDAPLQISFKSKFVELDEWDFPGHVFTPEAIGISNVTKFPVNGITLPEFPAVFNYQLTNSVTDAFGAALIDSKMQEIIQSLEKQPGVEVFSVPGITTLSARQAQIFAGGELDILTDKNSTAVTKLKIGPSLDVMAKTSADEFSFRLTASATVSRLLDPPDVVLPRMQFSQLRLTTDLWDGATLMMGGVEGPTQSAASHRKWLLVFVTPTLIYPDGTLYHSEDEMPFREYPTPIKILGTTNASVVEPIKPKVPPAKSDGDNLPSAQGGRVPSDEVLSKTREYQTNKVAAMTLVQDARVLLDAGKWDEAENKFNQAKTLDPSNIAVTHYAELIQERRAAEAVRMTDLAARLALLQIEQVYEVPLRGAQNRAPNNYIHTNVVSTSKGRENIKSKLNQIYFDIAKYDGLPLSEVITSLSQKALARDPDRVGINFMFDHTQSVAAGAIDPATGLPIPTGTEAQDIASVPIRIMPELRNMKLADVLDAVVASAATPIRYSIEDYAVMFALKGPEKEQLYTRIFHIDPNTFVQGLANVAAVPIGAVATDGGGSNSIGGRVTMTGAAPGAPAGVGGLNFTTTVAPIAAQQAAIIAFFLAAGVDLSSTAVPPRSIFWNDRKGTLLITATASELEIVARAMEELNWQPPQINLKIRFVELDEWDFPGHVFSLEAIGIPNVTHPVTGLSLPGFPAIFNSQLTNSVTEAFSGILVAPDAKAVLRKLEQQPGVTVLSDTEVTTLSGRQAQPQAEELIGVLTNKNSIAVTKLPFGPQLEVLPDVSSDEFSVRLAVTATLSRLLDKPDVVLPRMRFDQLAFKTIVWDAQTLVLGGAEGPAPQAGGHRKWFLVFVTPTIINPDGTRYHSDDEMPFANKPYVPPTPKPGTTNASAGQNPNAAIIERPQERLAQINRVSDPLARTGLKAKLDRIRIGSLSSDGLPLWQVMTSLNEQTRVGDPDRQGINFILDHATPPAKSPDRATGLPFTVPAENLDIGKIPIRIMPGLQDTRLVDVLDAIAKSAATPICYYLKENAVVFALKTVEPLHTRVFRFDPNIFAQGLSNVAGVEIAAASVRGGGGGGSIVARVTTNGVAAPAPGGLNFTTNAAQGNVQRAAVLAFFQAAGVDLSPTATPPRSFFWNDRRGSLMVTASEGELDTIARIMAGMNEQPWPPTIPSQPTSPPGKTNASLVKPQDASAPAVRVAQAAEHALRLQEATVRVRQTLDEARLAEQQRKLDEAVRIYQRCYSDALSIGPTVTELPQIAAGLANVLLELAEQYRNRSQFQLADEKLRRALSVEPQNARALAMKAENDHALGRATTSGLVKPVNAATTAAFSGVMADPQFKPAIRELEQRQGVNVPAATEGTEEPPPQVNLKVKFVEKDHGSLIGSMPVSIRAQFAVTSTPSASGAPVVFLTPSAPVASSASDGHITSGLRNGAMSTAVGILSDPQFKVVLQMLEQREDVEMLAVPEWTTSSGRQLYIDSGPYAQRSDTTNHGGWSDPAPVLRLIPTVSTDRRSIQLTLLPSEAHFDGYDGLGQFVVQAQVGSGGPLTSVLLPHFLVQMSSNSAVVPDGQTLVISIPNGMPLLKDGLPHLGSFPQTGRPSPGEPLTRTNKNMLIFVAPTTINPDGTRSNSAAKDLLIFITPTLVNPDGTRYNTNSQ